MTFEKQPLKIGQLELSNRLIQAPLAGISCSAFRELFSLYTKPAYAVTEMISAHSLIQHHKLNERYLSHSKLEGPWCIQLSGHESELVYKATKIAESYQPDLIDLNCGCPKPKIRGKGCGSALMDCPKDLHNVVSAMRKATNLPLTVKIRVAGNTDDQGYLEAVKIIEQCGADAIIVHGRHHSEDYDVKANYEQIQKVVNSVKIPVIANGDVNDLQSMMRCFNESGASGIMIARGSIGKPWLFKQLLEGIEQPLINERLDVFKYHIQKLAILEKSEFTALLQARRLLKWYFSEYANSQLETCYKAENLNQLFEILQSLLLVSIA